jgi:hypothetical protein
VQKEIPGIMAGIRKLLRVDDAPGGKQKESDKKEASSKKKATKTADEFESESETAKTKSKRGEQVSRTDGMEISGSEGSGDEDMAQFDGRLAPGSDSEAEADSESGDEDDEANDISDSISRSPSPSFSAENSPPPKKAKATKGSAAPVQSTTFLPSLMAGGYWSGSEEATDEEADAQPKRKNRMGQQARRALWEKKFGAGANHVKQEEIAAKYGGRDNGWDTKRGATDGARGRGGKRGGFGGGFGRANRDDSGPHGGQKPGKPKGPPKDEGPLHPSWEAKRKAKEQAPATFAGKKVTFD